MLLDMAKIYPRTKFNLNRFTLSDCRLTTSRQNDKSVNKLALDFAPTYMLKS